MGLLGFAKLGLRDLGWDYRFFKKLKSCGLPEFLTVARRISPHPILGGEGGVGGGGGGGGLDIDLVGVYF